MKKIILAVLIFALCLPFAACGNNEQANDPSTDSQNQTSEQSVVSENSNDSTNEYIESEDYNGTVIAYIPLDNRPVNFDRAFYLAESAGMKLVMPEESLVSTTLGKDYDQGNPKEVFEWLKSQDADYYVLSMDMLFSGGLVGSRAAFVDKDDSIANPEATFGNYELTATEQEIIDYIIDLAAKKHVVLFDTVMRLASTVDYGGWNLAMYNYLRGNYASVERTQYYDDELNLENIIGSYTKDKNGNLIPTTANGTDNSAAVDEYLKSRERKMIIADAIYSKAAENVEGLFIGVDDSTPYVNIQSNEIRYLEEKLIKGCDNAILFAGADELGLMGISEVVTSIYGKIKVNLQYFGNGEKFVADDFDPDTLGESVVDHIAAVGGVINSESPDMDLLVLTRSAATGSNAALHKNNVNALVEKLKENLDNNILTCVIDASGGTGYGPLAQAMIDAKLDLGELLGFSAWNTVGNAVGIALSNATARCSYLKNSAYITEESHVGFMKVTAFAQVKDTAYRKFGNAPANTTTANYKTFVNYAKQLTDLINKSSMFVSLAEQEDKYDVSLSDLRWPWNRSFEASFTIDVHANGNYTVFGE